MSKKRSKSGYVYVITNENFNGFCKVGVTIDIKKRLQSYQTSSPHRNFKIQHYIFHPDCYGAEERIRKLLKYFALSIKNEWYEIPIEFAIDKVNESLNPEEKILT
jgi:predicted GIY-YIG superfamily endonuclease